MTLHWHCLRHDGGPVGWITDGCVESSDCWICNYPGDTGYVGAKAVLVSYDAHRTHFEGLQVGEEVA